VNFRIFKEHLKDIIMKNSIKVLATITLSVAMVFLTSCVQQGIPTDVKDKLDKYIEYWNTGQFDGIENVLCEDYELLGSPNYEPQKGIESFKKAIKDMLIAYPDFHLMIDETVYEKGKIALIWSISATNTGQGRIPPTGKMIKGQGISVIHLKDGKIKDEWLANNNLLWLKQLGYTIVPPKSESGN
jgi:predicted ester cyclase